MIPPSYIDEIDRDVRPFNPEYGDVIREALIRLMREHNELEARVAQLERAAGEQQR